METPQAHPASAPHQGPEDRPGVFLISCTKCTKECEVHGTEKLLARALLAQGWVVGKRGMICPHCPCASEPAQYNRTRETERKARRAA